MQMQNYGSTKTYMMRNGKKHLNKINWNLNYDGDHVLGKVYVNNDNDRKQYNVSLNNNDIAQLFNMNAVNKPIDDRLQDDFFKSYAGLDEEEDENKEEPRIIPIHFTSMRMSPNYGMNEFIEPIRDMTPMIPMHYRRNPTLRRRIHFHMVPGNNRTRRRNPLRKPIRVTPYPVRTTMNKRRKRPIYRRSLTSINK
jgi:hypothetical protein